MNFEVMDAVLAANLQPASLKLVAVVMAVHANKDSARFWPSVRTLAAECSLSETQLKRILAQMRELQLLRKVEASAGGSRSATTVYEFDLSQLRLAADPGHQRTPSSNGPRPAMSQYPGHWRPLRGATDDTSGGPSMDHKGEVKWNGTEPKSRRAASATAPGGRSASSRRNAVRVFEPEV